MNSIRFTTLILVLSFASTVEAAMNARVVSVRDSRTIVITTPGGPENVRLHGIAVTDEAEATTFLRVLLTGAYVFIDPRSDGALVYRSPDALFVNGELVRRGYATATSAEVLPKPRVAMIYIGELNPAQRGESREKPETSARKPVKPAKPRAPRARASGR